MSTREGQESGRARQEAYLVLVTVRESPLGTGRGEHEGRAGQ